MTTSVRYLVTWAVAVALAATAVLAVALLLGGGAPAAPPPGVASDPRVPAWLGDVAGLASVLVGAVAVGFGLLRVARPAAHAAAAWTSLSVLQLGIHAWEQRGRLGVLESATGQAIALQGVLAFVAAAGWAVADRAPGRSLALPASLAALLPVVLAGHPRSADNRWLASVSVSVHVVAAAVWVGGLAALLWLCVSGGEWRGRLRRYSTVALVAVVALAASGVVAAVGRLGPSELFTSKYGALIVLKAVALGALAGAGWLQRTHIVGRLTGVWRPFVALATFELTVMTLAMALAAALSRTPPP